MIFEKYYIKISDVVAPVQNPYAMDYDMLPPPPPEESPDLPQAPPVPQGQGLYAADKGGNQGLYAAEKGGNQGATPTFVKKDVSPDTERRQDSGIGESNFDFTV